MKLLRPGLGSVNSTVGAVRKNAAAVIAGHGPWRLTAMQLAAFPELVMCGYPPEDLVLFPRFITAQWQAVAEVARATAELPTLFVLGVLTSVDSQVYNCAAVLHRGEVLGLVPKEKLPLYSVFYESRTLSPGGRVYARSICRPTAWGRGAVWRPAVCHRLWPAFRRVCEDIWSPQGPMSRRCLGPRCWSISRPRRFASGSKPADESSCAREPATIKRRCFYVNAVGSNDGLVFDGGGFVAQNGRLLFGRAALCRRHQRP